MSTRQERMQRHKLAQAARERLKSGQVQQQDAGPYQSTRARAMAAYVPPAPEPVKPVIQPVIPSNVKSGPLQPMTSQTDYKDLAKEVKAQEYLTNEKKKVDESNAPGFIKAYANWMDNALVNNPVGRFVNRVSNAGAHALGIDTEAANAVPQSDQRVDCAIPMHVPESHRQVRGVRPFLRRNRTGFEADAEIIDE